MATYQDSHPFHWHYDELDDKNFQLHGRGLLLMIILFSLFLFFTILCLYARWVYRYRHHPPSISSFTAHPTPPPAPSLGLDPASIQSLPIFLHRTLTTASDEAQCSICLCTFQYEDNVKVLPQCLHAFHPDCVDKWLKTHSSCPLCRSSLRVDTAVP
uniref:RING-type E3 ubiquitin transferase n=1 Tax=Nelumbo nucifera TaxID=4432 RepID=A0A822Y2E8_NELNU|nr:TPA_asm: hypothetical protein HUJ06_029542 [Nelumbo nucifera]